MEGRSYKKRRSLLTVNSCECLCGEEVFEQGGLGEEMISSHSFSVGDGPMPHNVSSLQRTPLPYK